MGFGPQVLLGEHRFYLFQCGQVPPLRVKLLHRGKFPIDINLALQLRYGVIGATHPNIERRTDNHARNQGHHHSGGSRHQSPMPLHIFLCPVANAGWSGRDRLATEMPLDVTGQFDGRTVASTWTFLQRFHHNPVQVAANQPG